MSIATTAPVLETETKPTVTSEICDACGGSVKARHVAFKDDFQLYFCTHHAREKVEKLVSQGFEINPSELEY